MFKSRRKGFTLAEVLVTVAIVAIIAAAVVPAVTSQISKGEETTVATAITSTRSSLTAFVSDVRTFPMKLSYLTTLIAVTDSTLGGTVFSASQVARWRGPYTTTSTFAVNGSISIGMGLSLADSLKDSLSFVVATGKFAAAVPAASVLAIESLFDATSSATGGMVRWTDSSGTAQFGRLKFFLTSSR